MGLPCTFFPQVQCFGEVAGPSTCVGLNVFPSLPAMKTSVPERVNVPGHLAFRSTWVVAFSPLFVYASQGLSLLENSAVPLNGHLLPM